MTEVFPNALANGIPEHIFWKLNPSKMAPYKAAHRIKLQNENRQFWQIGMYVNEAVSVAIANAFRGKGQKAFEYAKEPYRIFKPTPEEEAEMAEVERQKAIAFFNNLANNFERDQKPKEARKVRR